MNNALSDFIFQSKYSRYDNKLGRKETFEESVQRIKSMHDSHLDSLNPEIWDSGEFCIDYLEAIEAYSSKRIFGSQRGLQFGGQPILNKHCRLYNCSATYIDRLEVFKEIEWVLLCGCGVGISVEQKHIDKLPTMLVSLSQDKEEYVVEDSIEGWALAFDRLIRYYFIKGTKYPEFDYSLIRPKGSLISGGFQAPGPKGLETAINNVNKLLKQVHKTTKRLSALNATDIISYEADSVLSGGVRRSAMIVLFDPTNKEMASCKTGNWFTDNPQRGRFNMSAVLERDSTTKEVFAKLFKSTKEYGEPGFIWRSDSNQLFNPCCEIGLVPKLGDKSGWQFCNLVSISGREINSEKEFYKACKDAATLATIQASYQKFPFLGAVTEEIVANDPLIGVSIGGIMTNESVLLDEQILKKGAEIVVSQNTKIANHLGINKSSRSTCVKPKLLGLN